MRTLAQIKETLQSRGLSPKKALGQNFLIDQNLIRKLLDDALCDWITDEFADHIRSGQLALIRGDCLESKRKIAPAVCAVLGDEPFVHIANLPYSAATPLLLTLLVEHPNCQSMHVTIQREVADRLGAPPNSKTYGEISVITQALAQVRLISKVPASCFWPAPNVESAMISITRLDQPLTNDPSGLVEFTHLVFARRRKQLGSILKDAVRAGLVWPEGIRTNDRPEQLAPARMIELWRAVQLVAD